MSDLMVNIGRCVPVREVPGVEHGAVRMLQRARRLTTVIDRDDEQYVPADEVDGLDGADSWVVAARALWRYLVYSPTTGSIATGRYPDDTRPLVIARGPGAHRRAMRPPMVSTWMIRHAQDEPPEGLARLRIPHHADVGEVLADVGAEPLHYVRPTEDPRQRAWKCVGLPPWLDGIVGAERAAIGLGEW